MPDLIIKPKNQSGNKLILQDQAGGAVLTTADSGATLASTTTFPTGMVRQMKICPNQTNGASSSDVDFTAYTFDSNIISGNRVIISVSVTIEKRSATAGNSGDLKIVGTDLDEVVCKNIGDKHDVNYASIHATGFATALPSSTNPNYKVHWDNTNSSEFEFHLCRQLMYEVWV